MTPQLSKSRFQSGRQCLKRLYLEGRRPDLADPPDPGRQSLRDAGAAVGQLARRRFPGGRLIPETHLEHSQAVKTTADLISDPAIPALYEAAFTARGISIRADILKRNRRGFDLVAVKSAAKVKPEYVTDAAIQVYTVESAGIPVNRAYIMHVNNKYAYPGGPYDLAQLFTLADVTDDVRSFIAGEMPGELARMRAALQSDAAPEIATGRHCHKPHRCPFYGHCHTDESIDYRPPYINPDLNSVLKEIDFPMTFLDFESANPPLPLYPGTRPYQKIPFQWSMHLRDSAGRLTHKSHINNDADDPRERLAASLLQAIPPAGAIITYSPYESLVIKDLVQQFPQYAAQLSALRGRMVDLQKLLKANYYHPEFRGRYSLKSVLPAVAPDLDYADLDLADGLAATAAYARMTAPGTPECEKSRIRQSLLAYCHRDTEAMVRVYDALAAISAGR